MIASSLPQLDAVLIQRLHHLLAQWETRILQSDSMSQLSKVHEGDGQEGMILTFIATVLYLTLFFAAISFSLKRKRSLKKILYGLSFLIVSSFSFSV